MKRFFSDINVWDVTGNYTFWEAVKCEKIKFESNISLTEKKFCRNERGDNFLA